MEKTGSARCCPFRTSPVSRFNGKIELVQIDTGEDDNSHMIDPEELIRVAMSRQ